MNTCFIWSKTRFFRLFLWRGTARKRFWIRPSILETRETRTGSDDLDFAARPVSQKACQIWTLERLSSPQGVRPEEQMVPEALMRRSLIGGFDLQEALWTPFWVIHVIKT